MFLSKYGVARHIYLPIVKRGVVDLAVSADWTPAAGDVKISKDGGAAANVTNLPTAIAMGNTAVWDYSITATEMQAAQVVITIADSATKAVEDQTLIIETYGNASAQHAFDLATATQKVDVDTIKTNPVVNGGTITFPTTATLASTTNITAGTITTATNLTNAPTAGDFTAAMKTSLNAATPAVTVSDKTGFSLTAAYDIAKGNVALTESYAALHGVPTLAQILFEIRAMLAEKAVASTTLTAKKIDGSTTAATYTLNDATSPTSITRAS